MDRKLEDKSTIEEIRRRFDSDVERFSNLDTGQQAIMDAPLLMRLVAEAATACNPGAKNLLDIGCGAGNYTLRILQFIETPGCDLVDLSAPMLERAAQRVGRMTSGCVRTYQSDIRDVQLPAGHYDIIVAAAVLHHLRDKADWQRTFEKLFSLCAPGGSIWIADLISHENPAIEQTMQAMYSNYLEDIDGPSFRDKVLEVIDKEDSPQTLSFQLALMQKVGFRQMEVLHKHGCYAAFGAVKPLRALTQRGRP